MAQTLALHGPDPTRLSRREILVRNGKGGKDRVTVLPENLIAPLQEQISKARALHQRDLSEGFGAVWLPGATPTS
jgi:hypothetical protein